MKLTEAEKFNGWTAESLAAYRRERDRSFPQYDGKGKFRSFTGEMVAGNVVTEFQRPRPALVVEGPSGYSPFTRQHQ